MKTTTVTSMLTGLFLMAAGAFASSNFYQVTFQNYTGGPVNISFSNGDNAYLAWQNGQQQQKVEVDNGQSYNMYFFTDETYLSLGINNSPSANFTVSSPESSFGATTYNLLLNPVTFTKTNQGNEYVSDAQLTLAAPVSVMVLASLQNNSDCNVTSNGSYVVAGKSSIALSSIR